MRGWILGVLLAGCGGGSPPIDLRLQAADPETWSACLGGWTLAIEGQVNPQLADQPLTATVTVGELAPVERTFTPGANGAFGLELEVDERELSADCAAGAACAVDLVVRVSSEKEEGSTSRELTFWPATLPELSSARAGGEDLDDALAASADATLQISEVPDVGAVLADPSGGLTGTSGSVLLCPDEVDPADGDTSCLVVGSVFDPSDDGTTAEVGAPTGGMPALACSAASVADRALFRLWVRVEGHACEEPIYVAMSDQALRMSDGDCDDDGVEVGDDCDDVDPASYPGAPEVWYDGVDQACDGGDDDDADGDGHAAASEGGDDCEDTLPGVHPGALEVCDGVDNDCAAGGELPPGSVTTFRAGGGAPIIGASLAAAVASAADGDTIGLCPGAHAGGLTLAADLTLVGDPSQPTEIVGVPADREPVVQVADGVTATLRDLVIRGGAALEGGGVFAPSPAALTLEGCEVTGNQANTGGGVFVGGGTATFTGTRIAANSAASSGGGVEVRGPGTTAVLDVGTVIEGNTSFLGGGLALVDATLLADASAEIRDNDATSAGGGAYGTGTVDWDGGIVTGNRAAWGGGMSFDNGVPYGSVRLARVTVTANVATDGGGGLEFERTPTLSLDGVLVDGNTADEGGGVMLLSTGAATFNGAAITNNSARAGGGVAVLGVAGTTELTTLAGAISSNTAAEAGGGIEITEAEVQLGQGITGTEIHDNVAGTSGGGVMATEAALSVISANLRRNSAVDGGGLALETVEGLIVDGVLRENVATGNAPSLLMVGSHVRLDGSLDVDSGAATPGVAVAGQLLVVCANVTVQDTTRNLVEERALTACYDAAATTFTEYTAPDCSAECN